jgi:predicted ABC-type ATPase
MMTEYELKLCSAAVEFIRTHKQELIKKFADPAVYQPTEHPISLFMAGSPGAGKTEVSKRLMVRFAEKSPIRIDADEVRKILPGYTGCNSYIFQKACSKGVDKLHDHAIERHINMIMDSTFSSDETLKALERSIRHGRKIEIYYLYQDPALAWKFTQARELEDGRKISRDVFIKAFLRARENVNKVKRIFKEAVEASVIIKDFDKGIEDIIQNVLNVDEHLPKIYTESELDKLIVP